MRNLKSIAAFLLGLFALAVSERWFNIPPVPAFSVYIAATILQDDENQSFRKLLVFLITVIGVALYGYNLYMEISYFPSYGNFLAIVLDSIIAFLILGAGILNISTLNKKA